MNVQTTLLGKSCEPLLHGLETFSWTIEAVWLDQEDRLRCIIVHENGTTRWAHVTDLRLMPSDFLPGPPRGGSAGEGTE